MTITKSQIYDLLNKQNALIVHFSGCPKGSGIAREDNMYPNDLKRVLNNQTKGGLSCSTVQPGDCFDGPNINATGCIGVVLGLNNDSSLKAVSCDDCGSDICFGERNSNWSKKPTLISVEHSILNRKNGYNEWIVDDFHIIGVFAVSPFYYSVKTDPSQISDYPEKMHEEITLEVCKNTNVEEVIATFQNFSVFGFHDDKLCKWEAGVASIVKHKELYLIKKVREWQ